MKKTHKQVVGLVSLGAVAAMTVFAATLPSPGASATTQTVTDRLVVNVVEKMPDVNLTTPSGSIVTTKRNQPITFNYVNVSSVKLSMKHTAEDGTVTTVDNLVDKSVSTDYGSDTIDLNLADYGYGNFRFTLFGLAQDGASDTDAISVEFQWMNSDVETTTDGQPGVDLDYDDGNLPKEVNITVTGPDGETVYETTVTPPTGDVEIPLNEIPGLPSGTYHVKIEGIKDDGTTAYVKEYDTDYDNGNSTADDDGTINLHYDGNNAPERIDITVYDPSGKSVYTTTVTPPTRTVTIPFDDIPGLVSGTYLIDAIGYNAGGDIVYREKFNYNYEVEVVPVPDTGSFFQGLNISREDFLITGLIMFGIISIVGVGIIVRKKR